MEYFFDTHTHLYLEQFDQDRQKVVEKAIENGVQYMLLPNVDEDTIEPMLDLHRQHPQNCLPMMGLHPTSVKPGFEKVLQSMKNLFDHTRFYAVGETGIDLYWDKTFFELQLQSFQTQIEWALELKLPLVVHARNSLDEIKDVLQSYRNRGLMGVMHCFPGNIQQAQWFTDYGFHLGIGGVVTYKNSEMAKVAEQIPLDRIILETDAPYLPPVPYRGKRNAPSYIPLIAEKIAQLKNLCVNEVAAATSATARQLFNIS